LRRGRRDQGGVGSNHQRSSSPQSTPPLPKPNVVVLALRHGLRVLRAGGYFIVPLDVINGPWTCQPLLGKALPLARGALWLAARSGCFIVPVALVPRRRGHWDAWFGAPIEPTLASLARAREDCLRRAPATWELREWKAWHAAPLAPSTVASR